MSAYVCARIVGGEKTWRQYLTLPNIIKEYNPNLVGYALRASNTVERASQFNVAEDSAISADMPYMAKVLLKRITSDKRVNVKNDWKVNFSDSLQLQTPPISNLIPVNINFYWS